MMENKKISSFSASRNPWIPLGKYLVFSMIPLVSFLFAGEIILRAFNFRYSDTPLVMLSEPEKIAFTRFPANAYNFRKDKHQFWMSFPTFEERYASEKPPGTTRIITLGCSCTQACANSALSYPRHMEEILGRQFPFSYQVLNAAEGSYSSFQGLQRLKYTVLKYKPDLVTIFFGWNDHWVAGVPDHLIKMKADWQIDLINFLERFRTYQAYHWIVAKTKEKTLKLRGGEFRTTFRVPPEEYERNLNAMVDFCRSHNIQPVLITAPFDASTIKPFLNFPFSEQDLIDVHRAYNDIVRQVGESRQVPVIDLEAVFLRPKQQELASYFSDGIHFTPTGCRLVAELIVQRMQQLSLLKSPPEPEAATSGH